MWVKFKRIDIFTVDFSNFYYGYVNYSTAQVKEPKNSLFRISAFRELAKNTRNQTE